MFWFIHTSFLLLKLTSFVPSSILLEAIERYVRNVAEDVRDLKLMSNENGKRLIELDDSVNEKFQAQEKAAERRHISISDDVHHMGMNIVKHSEEWRSDENQRIQGKKIAWA